MPDEKILRDKARAAVRDGKLPSRDRTWGRLGVGGICTICDLPVVEFEIEFAMTAIIQCSTNSTYTSDAFAAWEFERRRDEH
jgi:hypothetical protein